MSQANRRKTVSTAEERASRWGHRRRLEFIDFRLLWEGRINRKELVSFFGISIQQASLDLAHYMKIAPANLRYDKSEKVYRSSPRFRAAFPPADSQRFLSQLLALAQGTLPRSSSFIGWQPSHDVVTFPTRSIRPEVLAGVLHAIRDANDLEVSYQSMRQSSVSRRWIAPHAIAFDGSRWHARSWCHQNNDFRDFVFARIQCIHGSRRSEVDSKLDRRWHSYASVVLRPRGNLTKPQRVAVEAEFGMIEGQLTLEVREALVFYVVRQLQLDRDGAQPIRRHPIEWVNEAQLAPLLAEAARK